MDNKEKVSICLDKSLLDFFKLKCEIQNKEPDAVIQELIRGYLQQTNKK